MMAFMSQGQQYRTAADSRAMVRAIFLTEGTSPSVLSACRLTV